MGDCLKRPELPIWVVCSESHFTTLFAADGRAASNVRPFDLFYFDGLANQARWQWQGADGGIC